VDRKAFGFLGILVLGFFVLTWVLPKQALSHHQERVLGDSTSSSQVVFPPITAGAGFILPDSPLFFLDQVFQEIRLLIAFTPERRAKTRALIAGERLAELRIMMNRSNPNGITTALNNLTEVSTQMAASLTDAAANGSDVKLLAKELNETIKSHRKILGILANQTDGTLRLQIKAAREALKEAKVEIEDELEEDELENEIEDDVDDEVEEAVEEANGSAKRLEHAIDVLTRLASEAAQRQQRRREEALRHAIEVKNEALQKQQEKFFEEELEKQEKILEAQKKAHEKARKAIEKAQEAAEEFEEAQEEIKALESEDNSGSGSENSGSSGSGNSGSGSGGGDSSGTSGK